MDHHTPPPGAAVHGRHASRERQCEAPRPQRRAERWTIEEALARCAAILADERGDWDAAAGMLQVTLATCDDVHVIAYAKSLLADAYVRRGVGLADPRQARDFYIDAAHAGIARGWLGIGRWYEGRDPGFRSVTPNQELAAHFFEQGVRARHLPCAAALARLQLHEPLRPRDRTAVMGVLREAAQRGDRRAGELLARLQRPARGDADRCGGGAVAAAAS